jgi:hypothetical protein
MSGSAVVVSPTPIEEGGNMPTEAAQEDRSVQIDDRLAHTEQYLAEALRAVQEAIALHNHVYSDEDMDQ